MGSLVASHGTKLRVIHADAVSSSSIGVPPLAHFPFGVLPNRIQSNLWSGRLVYMQRRGLPFARLLFAINGDMHCSSTGMVGRAMSCLPSFLFSNKKKTSQLSQFYYHLLNPENSILNP